MTGLNTIGPVEAGAVRCGAGTSIDQLLKSILPQGWFVPVTPGTRHVTVGGAVAADVHGKNHHRDGSIGSHLTSIDLLTADGELRRVGPADDPELFWATVGGMGMTGVVVAVTLRLLPVETSRMTVTTERAGDLDELMARLADGDGRSRYSVAWIDCMAGGRATGRGVITRGDHTRVGELPGDARHNPFAYGGSGRVAAPPWVPSGVLNRATVSLFNEAWYRLASRHGSDEVQTIDSFFYPLDGVSGWNRIYGSGGMLQYQCVLPYDEDAVLRDIVGDLSRTHVPSFLAVLKRFGPADPAPLSFPRSGWTLAIDIPARVDGLAPLLDCFDDRVVEAGGAVYLAKDSRLDPRHIAAMYPRLEEWRATRARVDPQRRFQSDQSRRLAL
jgi:decaprenylphospho-beta-D-ribofuranose 2-oxidase